MVISNMCAISIAIHGNNDYCVSIILEFYFKGILSMKKPGHVCNISGTWLIPQQFERLCKIVVSWVILKVHVHKIVC